MKQKILRFITLFLMMVSLFTFNGCWWDNSNNNNNTVVKFLDNMIKKENCTAVVIVDDLIEGYMKITKDAIEVNLSDEENYKIIKSSNSVKSFEPAESYSEKYLQTDFDMTEYVVVRNTAINTIRLYRDLLANGVFEYDEITEDYHYIGTDSKWDGISIKLDDGKLTIKTSSETTTYKNVGKTKIEKPEDEDILN